MRTMVSPDGSTIDVIEHILLQNMWEYYILEAPDENGVAFALVVGDYNELGNVSIDEVSDFIISRTTKLDNLLPAPQWTWKHSRHAGGLAVSGPDRLWLQS